MFEKKKVLRVTVVISLVELLVICSANLINIDFYCSLDNVCSSLYSYSDYGGGRIILDVGHVHRNVDVNFVDSILERIPINLLRVFPDTRGLHMRDCGLEFIEKDDFVGGSNLTWILLPHNCIKSIHDNTFIHTPNVTQLNLDHSCVSELSSSAFNGLHNLNTLHLSYNQIKTIRNQLFNPLKALESLFIDNNLIEIIENEVFNYNKNLKHIKINSNRIKIIGSEAFTKFKNFNYLDVSNNTFNEITIDTLDYLDISNCNVKEFHVKNRIFNLKAENNKIFNFTIKNLFSLRELNLRNNSLKSIRLLKNSKLLRLLDVSRNNIGLDENNLKIFNYLDNLEVLNLSHTNLTSFPRLNFKNLKHLIQLDLSHNRIATIDEELINSLGNLKILYLHNNLLHELDFSKLRSRNTHGYRIVEELTLHNNPWNCSIVPDIVDYLENNSIDFVRYHRHDKLKYDKLYNNLYKQCRNSSVESLLNNKTVLKFSVFHLIVVCIFVIFTSFLCILVAFRLKFTNKRKTNNTNVCQMKDN